jgi:hypothetical protein
LASGRGNWRSVHVFVSKQLWRFHHGPDYGRVQLRERREKSDRLREGQDRIHDWADMLDHDVPSGSERWQRYRGKYDAYAVFWAQRGSGPSEGEGTALVAERIRQYPVGESGLRSVAVGLLERGCAVHARLHARHDELLVQPGEWLVDL